MIPMPNAQALYQFLCKHKDKFKSRYRLTTPAGRHGPRLVRMLSKTDILTIQNMTIKEHDLSMRGRRRSGALPSASKRRSPATYAENHPLAHIFKRFA